MCPNPDRIGNVLAVQIAFSKVRKDPCFCYGHVSREEMTKSDENLVSFS